TDDGAYLWLGHQESPDTPLVLDLSQQAGEPNLSHLLEHVTAMSRVRRLALREAVDCTGVEFTALMMTRHLINLRHLDIGRCANLNEGTLGYLLVFAKRLTGLDLSYCDLGNRDVGELARAGLSQLTWLSLRGNHIGSAGARAIAESPHLRNLRHLDL